MNDVASREFAQRLQGKFAGIMQWQQLDELWGRVKTGA